MVSVKTLLTLSLTVVTGTLAANVASISDCPPLPARAVSNEITDLRIDDIKVIGALGDSIMAGFAMMGIDYEGSGVVNFSLVSEYRGNSYGIGGDSGAITLANFMKKYQPKVKGASVLSHLVSYCSNDLCGFPLSACMKTMMTSSSFRNDWKMITIQIGSNDQCAACTDGMQNIVSAESYGKYVEAVIARIKAEIPKTIVNLLGTFKVSGVFPLTAGQAYCVPNGFLQNTGECSCSAGKNWATMDVLSDAYNVQLQNIANKYKGTAGSTFAVMYSPAPIDLSSFPVDALSLKGHQWIAKAFWNQLFLPAASKPSILTFDPNLGIYCPTESDRLPIG
ncbi:hypothetical protein BDF20DRAFT_816011 [Mycotypha africana]|uniref:uncharacterized protein n=1 Tax=Mycotypha africana TaxID=64632 RepID=UPI002301460A|nr:uncharacterized protein BDF20DRAFT_816011 [Mycotypha africana]KAI8984114.1 hypothetical protein BDF20DRAFT_816011 [Mycotypha africana]